LLLYASGLRISEALNLDMADVDLEERLLQIRETKFYKTRLVPTGTDLTQVLREYALLRCKRSPIGPDAPFLLTRRGKRPSRAGAEEAFKQIREQAGVRRVDGARYQPRLHDLRHNSESRIIPSTASNDAVLPEETGWEGSERCSE
jgi:integrase